MLRRHLNFRQISHRFTSSFTNPSFQDLNGSHIMYWNMIIIILTLKEPGFLDPSHHSRGADPPPKISETDWRNIKCVVLVDSYDPPESIGTKKVQTYLVWRHSDVISDVMSKTRKSPKIAKIMVFRYFFKQSCIFWQWCVSKYAYTCSYSK